MIQLDYRTKLNESSELKTLHLQLEDETHRKLKQLAAEKDMTMKELIIFLLPFDESSEIDPKEVEKIKLPTNPNIKIASTPVKNNSEGKPSKRNICPQHLVDKDTCKLMKHKA